MELNGQCKGGRCQRNGFSSSGDVDGLTLAQVGGSGGSTGIMLAKAHYNLSLTVQNLPGRITNVQYNIAELPRDVQLGVQAFVHNFFQSEPLKEADVYILRNTMHNWPDVAAIKIVKGIVDVMAPSSRLLIMDMILLKPGSESSNL
jgi:6-hydroxytryprostatin B O-methyltransferase